MGNLVSLFVAPINRLGVTYMVTGAVAAIIYGEPRLTNDIDLVVELTADDTGKLEGVFPPPDYYLPPVEVLGIEVRRPLYGHFNVIHAPTALKADVYPSGDDALHEWALARRRAFRVDGEVVWTAPVEYVILRKLEYFRSGGSEKHLRDIRSMLREQGSAVNRDDLAVWVARLSLEREWALCSGE